MRPGATWGPSRLSRSAEMRANTCCAVSPKGWMIVLRSWYSRKRCSAPTQAAQCSASRKMSMSGQENKKCTLPTSMPCIKAITVTPCDSLLTQHHPTRLRKPYASSCLKLTHLNCGMGSCARGEASNPICEHGVCRQGDQTLQAGMCQVCDRGARRHAQVMRVSIRSCAGTKRQRM